VLALMVQGLSNTAIAARLVVSPSTAKAHVSSILAKLGVTSRTEAVALAMQHHLVN
jgi:NarL family two-component system response regulator LiaR